MTGRSPRSSHLILVLLVTLLSLGLSGCPTTFSAIDESALSEQDKALAKLFAAETSWVQAKEVLANVLTELAFVEIKLSPDVKGRIKAVLAGGNRAVDAARLALARGDGSLEGLFASALRSLQSATRSLLRATSEAQALAVAAPAPPPIPAELELEEATP